MVLRATPFARYRDIVGEGTERVLLGVEWLGRIECGGGHIHTLSCQPAVLFRERLSLRRKGRVGEFLVRREGRSDWVY